MRRVLVLGATSAIAQQVARLYAARGAELFLVARNEERLSAVADDLRTEFYAPGPNQDMDYMKEMLDYPYLIPGVSDGGAHTKFFTGGQYPTEFLAWLVRDYKM